MMKYQIKVSKNDLTSQLWGRSTWKGLHCITFGYPVEPTDEIKSAYFNFFTLLASFLPNRESRINYRLMTLSNDPKFAHVSLTKRVFTNRETLTLWFFNVHEEFNKLLNLNYGMTYDYFVKKYESSRAKCDKKASPNSGLITKIWGPPMWIMLHSMCYAYPENPSPKKKDAALKFFEFLGLVLPCIYCRESYAKFISRGSTLLDNVVVNSRRNLTIWAFLLHETVNAKLSVNYGVTLINVDNKYEAGRIKNGVYPVYYDNNYSKECPVIPISLVENFVYYAKERQKESQLISEYDFNYINKIKQGASITYDNSKCDFWCKRNIECNDIIKRMRLEGIPSLEESGMWKDLPTILEMKLILRLASNLDSDKLVDLVRKLPHAKNNNIYKLTFSQNSKNQNVQTKGCLMPANSKINSYKYSYMHECFILDLDLCLKFVKYAQLREINACEFNFIKEYYKYIKLKDKTINIERILIDRNHECDINIDYMKQNNISSIENEGKYLGLPTVSELKLIIRLTSNLSVAELTKLSFLVPISKFSKTKF